MLDKILSFSLNNRLLIIVISVALLALGTYLALERPVDVLPDLNRPTVVIMTEAHGMDSEDVEQLITLPIEQVLNGATGVERIRSSSALGLSIVKIEFNWNSEIYRNRQIIAEKLALAKARIPQGIEPIMTPIASIMGQIQIIGITSKTGKHSPSDIRNLVDTQIKYELLSSSGVAKVIVGGGSEKQVQVHVNSQKLLEHELSLIQVADAIRKSNQNRSAGFLEIGSKAPIISVKGLIETPEDLGKAFIGTYQGRQVTINDIAEVKFAPSPIRIGSVGINGDEGVALIIMKQPGYDTVKLSRQIEEKLKKMSLSLDPDLSINTEIFKQADFIQRAIQNVLEASRDAGIMVVLIIFIFLLNWRMSLITLSAIPLSIAITAIIFTALGLSINTMTLGGIAVAIGALVDDAIVDVENVFRRLKQNKTKPLDQQEPSLAIVLSASREVRKPIVIGTLLVILVYIPLFFLTGMEGKLFTPIGLAYILAILASLIVSLSLTPVMASYLLPKSIDKAKNQKDSALVHGLKNFVAQVIKISVKHAKLVLIVFLIAVGYSIFSLSQMGTQFLPPFNEGVAQINFPLPPDTGLQSSQDYGNKLEKLISKVDGVKNVYRRTGRAAGDEHAEGVSSSELIISFKEDLPKTSEGIIRDIRTKIDAEMPEITYGMDQPLSHLLSAMLSGIKAQVAIKIKGPDLRQLEAYAKEVKTLAEGISGVKDLMIEPQVFIPKISIEPKREILAQHGLSVEDLAETVELALASERVSTLVQGALLYPITLQIDGKESKSMAQIENLLIRKTDGSSIRLIDVAHIRTRLSPNQIKRENVSRRLAVQLNISDRALGEVVAELKGKLKTIESSLKEGYSIHISGQFEAQEKASQRITWLSIFSAILMFFILFLHFKSSKLSLQVMASIPMALIGAVAYMQISQQDLSIASLVGLISLGGIAARNAILLIDHYIHLQDEEAYIFGPELIIRAGQERMLPVVMTALTSGIALIPLALDPEAAGKEILYPVATVIIGGLISSTILEFIVTPAAYALFGKRKEQ